MNQFKADSMRKLELLRELGAGEIAHLNGSLLDHLQGTESLLRRWHAKESLCDAGLFHAAYGTASFGQQLIDKTQRQQVAEIIGSDAEALVYLYAACDRGFFFPQFDGSNSSPVYRDRFDGREFTLPSGQCRALCELTAANELELCLSSDKFKTEYGSKLLQLFIAMGSQLSQACQRDLKNSL